MKRILLRTSYDGTLFHGSALQPGKRTVELEINNAIKSLTGEDISVISASRTDTGVHARDFVSVFDSESPIPPDRFYKALNTRLPEDIRVWDSKEVSPSFHPRRVDSKKTYEYHISVGRTEDPLSRNHAFWTDYDLDISLMNLACSNIVGEHDFTSFCAAGSQSVSKVRTVYSAKVYEAEDGKDSLSYTGYVNKKYITVRVCGSGFLYNMVRIIAGTLIEVGRGKIAPHALKDIIDGRDRSLAGPTAPPHGLLLYSYDMI